MLINKVPQQKGEGGILIKTMPGPSNQTQPEDIPACKSQPPVNHCNTSPKSQAPDTSQPQSLESAPKCGRGHPPKRASTDSSRPPPPRKVPKLSTPTSTPSNGPSAHSNVTSACVQLHLTV